MTAAAHPFAVARNRNLDWRPLLAPAPLLEIGQDFSLVLETGGQHPTPLTVRTWQDRSSTTWLLAYRSVPATGDLVAEDGGQLTDRFGRALYLVEGVAVPGVHELPAAEAEALIERVHVQAVAAFRDFWPREDEAVGPRASEPLVGEPLVGRPVDEDGPISRNGPAPLPLAAVPGLVALSLLLVLLRRRRTASGASRWSR